MEEKMGEVFQRAKSRLLTFGFAENQITTKMAPGKGTIARIIMAEAEEQKCSSIAIGRRGLSRVEEFFIGRISNEVIQMATDKAVWLIN